MLGSLITAPGDYTSLGPHERHREKGQLCPVADRRKGGQRQQGKRGTQTQATKDQDGTQQ